VQGKEGMDFPESVNLKSETLSHWGGNTAKNRGTGKGRIGRTTLVLGGKGAIGLTEGMFKASPETGGKRTVWGGGEEIMSSSHGSRPETHRGVVGVTFQGPED